ncbi:PRC-barrel domain containing protein [Kitasatospora sp. NBC_01539]|uniref:PRC-barrel domain containing protein n=1 Tax=Kitasatospora sp. NBC_01539 TaxID=2903577 RepID=UPI0038601490
MSSGMWDYQNASGYTPGSNLAGYRVEATDGHIGKIDKHSEDVSSSYVVVDTGPWIFGKHVLLPAGTITRVDTAEETVWVDRSKEEIKNSPEFDPDKHAGDAGYHDELGSYYGDPRL